MPSNFAVSHKGSPYSEFLSDVNLRLPFPTESPGQCNLVPSCILKLFTCSNVDASRDSLSEVSQKDNCYMISLLWAI